VTTAIAAANRIGIRQFRSQRTGEDKTMAAVQAKQQPAQPPARAKYGKGERAP
jgi:hypothetical protein